MRIDSGLPIHNALEIEKSRDKTPQKSSVTGQRDSGVTVDVSLHALEKQAISVSDIRTDRVAQLKAAMQSGSYQVSDTQLADAILGDVLRG